MEDKIRTSPYDQRLARMIVTPLKNLPLHPNYFTFLTLLLGQTSSWLFAFAMAEYSWLAALCYMLAVLTDHMDGEYARLTGKITSLGHKLDYVVGGINYTTLFIGIGIGLFPSYGMWALVPGFAAGLSNPFILYLRMQMESRYGKKAVEHPAFGAFDLEDFIYLIGPVTWLAGVIWFFVPFALGNIGYLVWTGMEYHHWNK